MHGIEAPIGPHTRPNIRLDTLTLKKTYVASRFIFHLQGREREMPNAPQTSSISSSSSLTNVRSSDSVPRLVYVTDCVEHKHLDERVRLGAI